MSTADARGRRACCWALTLRTAGQGLEPQDKGLQNRLTRRVCCTQEAYGPRGTSGSVAAGEEAALTSVAYQLGYTVKDVGVDFQVPHAALGGL